MTDTGGGVSASRSKWPQMQLVLAGGEARGRGPSSRGNIGGKIRIWIISGDRNGADACNTSATHERSNKQV